MKILFLTEYFPETSHAEITGGVEARIFYLTKYLKKKHQVTIITSRQAGQPRFQKYGQLVIYRVGLVTAYSRTGIFPRIVFMSLIMCKGISLKFDIIEAASFFTWLPGFILAKLKHKKNILLIADLASAYSLGINPVLRLFIYKYEQILIKLHWDKIICISNTVKKKVQKKYKRLNSEIIVIYCGLDKLEVQRIQKRREMMKNRLSCVSRLVAYKRIEDIIFALVIVKKIFPNIHLDLVGNGEELENLQNLVQICKLNHTITFHKFIRKHADVLKIVARSQLFIFPSIVEGFGIATVEALALGVPAIVSDTPIHREILLQKGVAYFKPKSATHLAQKIVQILRSKQIYNTLKIQTNNVMEVYDWKKIAQKTDEAYQSVFAY